MKGGDGPGGYAGIRAKCPSSIRARGEQPASGCGLGAIVCGPGEADCMNHLDSHRSLLYPPIIRSKVTIGTHSRWPNAQRGRTPGVSVPASGPRIPPMSGPVKSPPVSDCGQPQGGPGGSVSGLKGARIQPVRCVKLGGTARLSLPRPNPGARLFFWTVGSSQDR